MRSLDTGTTKKVADALDVHSLNWSPSGSMIAFVSGNSGWVTGGRLGNIAPSSIWILTLADGRTSRVTDDISLNTSPVWMPDGQSLLFVSNRSGSRDIYQ